jgi:DhnA family fructose-bisphosphate aldolase class Ia
MYGTGTEFRLRRLFDAASETSIIIPMDQAIEGNFTELEDPRALVRDMCDAGANGFLMRRGLARFTAESFAGRAAWVERLTGRSALEHQDDDQLLLASPEQALYNGADAVVFTIFFGKNETANLPAYGRVSDECRRIGLPLIGEPFPIGGPDALPYDGPYEVDDIRVAVRTACEEGADLIKTYYPGSPADMARIVAYSTVPVLIAGGPKAKRPRDVLEMVKGAMDGGASGTVVGRKIWQSEDPGAMIHAVARIVREGLDVDQAMAALGKSAIVVA